MASSFAPQMYMYECSDLHSVLVQLGGPTLVQVERPTLVQVERPTLVQVERPKSVHDLKSIF